MAAEQENQNFKAEGSSYTWDALSGLLTTFEETIDPEEARRVYAMISERHESDQLLERFFTDKFVVPFIFKVLAVYLIMHTAVLGEE